MQSTKVQVLRFILAGAAVFACNDQMGEPIQLGPPISVFVPPQELQPVLTMTEETPVDVLVVPALLDADEIHRSDAGSGSTEAGAPFEAPSGDNCVVCSSGLQCGSEAERCIVNTVSGESFCGSACESDADCPNGSLCVQISGASESVLQCVPQAVSCLPSDSASLERALTEIHLGNINDRRAGFGLEPLSLSSCLNRVAGESQDEFIELADAHTKFERECLNVEGDCECGWHAHFQVQVLREGRSVRAVLETLHSPDGVDGWAGDARTQWVGFEIAYTDTRVWVTNAYGRL